MKIELMLWSYQKCNSDSQRYNGCWKETKPQRS